MNKLASIDAIIQKTGEYYNAGDHTETDIKLFIGERLQEAYDTGRRVGEVKGMADGTKYPWTS